MGYARPQQVEVMSKAAFPLETAGGVDLSSRPSISDDGRYVVFWSTALNLVAGQIDANNNFDVFLHDRVSGTTSLVSHTSSPTEAGNGVSDFAVISGDGAYVAFVSAADNLGSGITDFNFGQDVFLYERATGNISLVSHTSSSTTTGNLASRTPAINADGNWVAFVSDATDLGSGFTEGNVWSDVFLYDRATGNIQLVSHQSSPTTTGNDLSESPAISADGSWVAFTSLATDLGSGITDPGVAHDVFLFERATGGISLVSHTASPTTAGNGISWVPVISRNGNFVAFESSSNDLVSGMTDTNSTWDVFLYERVSGTLSLVSHAASPTMTANGRSDSASLADDGSYVAFLSFATDLGTGYTDTNGTSDIFVYEKATGAISLASRTFSATNTGNSLSRDAAISGDGSLVAFSSQSSDLGTGLTDGNSTVDVYLFERVTGNLSVVSHAASPTTTANEGSETPAMSRDGAFVAFRSYATNLGPGFLDPPGTADVFVFERSGGGIQLATRASAAVSSTAGRASQTLSLSSMSDNGRFVVFESFAPNILPGQVDTNDNWDVFLYDRLTGTVSLVSHTSMAVTAGNAFSKNPVISRDGNWVAFESTASDLGPGFTDGNSQSDVFLYERASGNITLVSHTSSPTTTGTGRSEAPSITADGSHVAFHSFAPNLGSGFTDSNSAEDVFVFTRATGAIALASHTASPTTAGNAASRNPVISGDGSQVGFESSASNLGVGFTDANARQDVFLYAIATGSLALASHTAVFTTTANDHSNISSMSFDGAWALFESRASNLGSGLTDTNASYDLFLFERATGAITLVSHTSASPTTAANGASPEGALSADGVYVAFRSGATNLAAGVTDTNGFFDVFVYDRVSGAITLVSHTSSPTTAGNNSSDSPVISRDGSHIAFRSSASNLGSGFSATDGIYLFERVTGAITLVSHRASSLTAGANSFSFRPALGGDGDHVAFTSLATDLVANDLNGDQDAFLFSRACAGNLLSATGNGDNRIDLSWTAAGTYTYQILRSLVSGGPYTTIASASGTSFIDTTAEGGITYFYRVSNACGTSNEASAATTGLCQLPPDFAGASSATQIVSPTCTVEVAWPAASSPCGGSVTYSVFRDTSPAFAPDPTTRLATGVAASPYADTAGIVSGTSYYYIVRATSPVNGEEDANLVTVSVTPAGCTNTAPAPVTFFNVRSGDSENVLDWVNPTGTFSQTHIGYTDDGSAPTCAGPPVPGSPFAGAAGARGRTSHAVTNGLTYRYAACAEGPGAGLSAERHSSGRPDATGGNWKWSYTTGSTALSASGVIPNLSYFVVSNDRVLHGLALGTSGGTWPLGPPEWFPFPTIAPVQGRPTVVKLPTTTVSGASTIALIGSQDGRVYAVNAETGSQLWASPVLGASVQMSPGAMFSDFGGAYDLVFAGTREAAGASRFYALHLGTGAVAWSFDNGGGANAIGIISSAAQVDYAQNRIYFASRKKSGGSSKTVWGLGFTGSSATPLWSVDVGSIDGSPVLAGGVLYVGNNAGEVHALDPADGSPLWAAPWATGDGTVKGFVWPDVATRRLYFSTTTSVHAIHDDGGSASPFWTAPVAIGSPSRPLLSDGRLYVGGDSSRLYSIDATSPTPAAPTSVVLGDPATPKIIGTPTLDFFHSLVIVGSDLGVVYAVLIPF